MGILYVCSEFHIPFSYVLSQIQIPDDVKLLKTFSLASIDDGLLISAKIPNDDKTVFVQMKHCPEKNE